MGGGCYSFDVAQEARSSNREVFNYRGYGTDSGQATARRVVHPLLTMKGQKRECQNETPIVVAMDVTRSRGNDSRIMYEKLPLFLGQMTMKNYLPGVAISFAAIGDADGDHAPLQVSQWEADNRLDEALSKFWLEEGGGGNGRESYELCAYYYARHTKLACQQQGRKGYFFFVGDEGFYPEVNPKQIENICGFTETDSISSKQIFRELQDKFHTFFIYPHKGFTERKADIDAEIRQRVEKAGGMYAGVDIRASLIWDNTHDLDLHVLCPSGAEIYFGNKISPCGGMLDVDRNVHGETIKPVENIRWARGAAKPGRYRVFVQNFRFHGGHRENIDFKIELEVNGQFRHFEGKISPKGETGTPSNVTAFEFDFVPPDAAEQLAQDEAYKNYSDESIRHQWGEVLPAENILTIDDPSSVVDVMLGAIALHTGKESLDSFAAELKKRESTSSRISEALHALKNLSLVRGMAAGIDLQSGIGGEALLSRGSGSKRL